MWGMLAAVRGPACRGGQPGAQELAAGRCRRTRAAYLASLARDAGRRCWCCGWRCSPACCRRAARRRSAYLALATVAPACACSSASVRSPCQLAPTRRVALELRAACSSLGAGRCGSSPTPSSAGLAALGHAAWAGARNCAPFTGARPIGARAAGRWRRSPCSRSQPARIAAGARRRHGACCAGATAHRPRLFGALLADRAGAARRAPEPRRLARSACGFFALIIGLISNSVSWAGHLRATCERELRKLGGSLDRHARPAISASASCSSSSPSACSRCSQMAAARHEEAEERLETLFALPRRPSALARRAARARELARRRSRSSLAAGLLAWVGAASQDARRLAREDARSRRQLPARRAPVPRRSPRSPTRWCPRAGTAHRLRARRRRVRVAAVRRAARRAPSGCVELSPFQHVGLVPAQPFRGRAPRR